MPVRVGRGAAAADTELTSTTKSTSMEQAKTVTLSLTHSNSKFLHQVIFFQQRMCVNLSGCHLSDGRFYVGGETWDLPGCGRGVCAKVLQGGWQVAEDRYTKCNEE